MYDFEDYLVATLSTLFVTVPALIMLWQIFRATFPKRVKRELSSTKRRHHDVGNTPSNSDIIAYRATCIAAGVRPTIYGLESAQARAEEARKERTT